TAIEQVSELGETIIQKLVAAGITTVESLADMTPEQLEEIPGIGEKTLERISVAVRHYFGHFEEGEEGQEAESSEGSVPQSRDAHQSRGVHPVRPCRPDRHSRRGWCEWGAWGEDRRGIGRVLRQARQNYAPDSWWDRSKAGDRRWA